MTSSMCKPCCCVADSNFSLRLPRSVTTVFSQSCNWPSDCSVMVLKLVGSRLDWKGLVLRLRDVAVRRELLLEARLQLYSVLKRAQESRECWRPTRGESTRHQSAAARVYKDAKPRWAQADRAYQPCTARNRSDRQGESGQRWNVAGFGCSARHRSHGCSWIRKRCSHPVKGRSQFPSPTLKEIPIRLRLIP